MAGDERSHQVRAGTMQGYNCFLYFHFLPLSVTMNKVKWQRAVECEVCVCVFMWLCVVPSDAFWRTGNKGQTKIGICGVRGHTEADGLDWSFCVFVTALSACASSLLWVGKQRVSGDHLQPAPNRAKLVFRSERAEKVLCAVWGRGSVMFSGMICSWCFLVSYVDLFALQRFLLFVCSGSGRKNIFLPGNNEHLLYFPAHSPNFPALSLACNCIQH